LIVENEFQGHKNQYSLELVFIFLFAQILRYWAIITLGIFWNTRIIVLKNSELIKKGPYKYIKHPNYLAVVLEFLTIPLIFSLYITSITFSLLNLIVLWRRVRIEESVLGLK
jgi:methyltransferase